MRTVEPDPVLKAYGPDDLADLSNFQGGYINFGYWKDISNLHSNAELSIDDRIASSKALYDFVFNFLDPNENDSILEVGCGRGLGCATLASACNPTKIIGIDITSQQIERANLLHKDELSRFNFLSYQVCAAEKMNFPKDSFNKIFSIEAAQHFNSVSLFVSEAKRILYPHGRLVLATHFATNEEGYIQMQKQNLFVKEGIDRLIPIQQVISALKNADFKSVKYHTIGEHVFHGYEKWITQINCPTPWSHNIYKSYEKEYLDYYLIVAE